MDVERLRVQFEVVWTRWRGRVTVVALAAAVAAVALGGYNLLVAPLTTLPAGPTAYRDVLTRVTPAADIAPGADVALIVVGLATWLVVSRLG